MKPPGQKMKDNRSRPRARWFESVRIRNSANRNPFRFAVSRKPQTGCRFGPSMIHSESCSDANQPRRDPRNLSPPETGRDGIGPRRPIPRRAETESVSPPRRPNPRQIPSRLSAPLVQPRQANRRRILLRLSAMRIGFSSPIPRRAESETDCTRICFCFQCLANHRQDLVSLRDRFTPNQIPNQMFPK